MNKGFVDYYKILGVEPTNDINLIKRAYKKQAKQTHPDVNGTGDDTEFKKVQDAYDTLNSEEILNEYYEYYMERQRKIKEQEFRRNYESYVVNKPEKETKKNTTTTTKRTKSKSKLRVFFNNFRKNDYVLRVTKTVGALAAVMIVLNMAHVKKQEMDKPTEDVLEYTQTIINDEAISYELIRNYEVQPGDTLYDLANEIGTSVDRIKEVNKLEDDTIYADKTIKLPYEVQKEDLEYYTTSQEVKDKSIYDLADAYNTTTETIYNLNRDSIYSANGKYFILSDTVKVPNFLSKKEVETIKNYENIKVSHK